MGGWGSGPYGPMGPLVRKRTVEETYYIHVQDYKDAMDDCNITCSWSNGNKIRIITKHDHLYLMYKADEEFIKTRVNIDYTKVGYGKRMWFNCPYCGDRTSRLYHVGKHFRCRDCHGLTYSTCQESGDPLDYYYLKIKRLQRKLGLKNPSVDDRPYFKPKYMHQKTFDKLRFRLEWLQEKRDREFIRQCGSRFGIY